MGELDSIIRSIVGSVSVSCSNSIGSGCTAARLFLIHGQAPSPISMESHLPGTDLFSWRTGVIQLRGWHGTDVYPQDAYSRANTRRSFASTSTVANENKQPADVSFRDSDSR